jgi:hypothetical protein
MIFRNSRETERSFMWRRYIAGETNHCPGCDRSHWIIGRSTAECAFCHTALPLADSHQSAPRLISFGDGGGKTRRAA